MSSEAAREKLNSLLRKDARDPLRMERFLDTWNQITDTDATRSWLMLSGEMERDIDNALRTLEQADAWLADAAALKSSLSVFPHPTMLVREDGVVVSINDAAFERLAIEPGQSIDEVPVSIVGGRDLSDEVRHTLRYGRNRHGLNFIPAVSDENDRNLMLTILTHENPNAKTRAAVVIAVDPVWSHQYEGLFAEAFGLTETETEILLHFLNGQSAEQIAHARRRSLLTIRTQLQAILNKSGASSQAELMRMAFAIGQFGRDVADVTEVVGHPHRRRFEIPAADGRKIEFYLSGNPTGRPILFVPDITTVTFPAKVEAALMAAGVCVASVLRPGCGMTDLHPDTNTQRAIASDLEAVSSQLGWERPALLLHSSSCHFAPALASALGDSISRVLLCSVPAPPPYLIEFSNASPWLISMARARHASPVMFRLIVTAGIMGWRALGTQKFAAIQLRSSALDVAELQRSESLREMDRAMRCYFSQAVDEICADARRIFSDWNADWPSTGIEVRILQGGGDATSAKGAVRAMADAHNEFMSLLEIEEAGFMLPVTHVETFVRWLRQGADLGKPRLSKAEPSEFISKSS